MRFHRGLQSVLLLGPFWCIPSVQALVVVLVRPLSPGIGLINDPHELQHQQGHVLARRAQVGPQLGSDGTCFTDEGRCKSHSRVL
jgi:hypothetical protein